MKRLALAAVMAAMTGGLAMAEGNVYIPKDGTSFEVTENDVVRFAGPAPRGTGVSTTLSVAGDAKASPARPVYSVVDGKPITVGGGGPEFDVRPTKGKKGKVRVTLTFTGPGEKVELKEYEFEVK